MEKKIICIGNIVVDVIIGTVEKLPKNGEVFFIDTMKLVRGGCASNTSYGLAKLGMNVKLVSKVGKDYFGEFVLNSLKKDRVNINGITYSKVNTSSCVVLISPNGERSFYYCPGASDNLTKKEVDKNINQIAKKRNELTNTILHIASPSKLPKLDIKLVLKKGKQMGMFTTMDVDWNENALWVKKVKSCLKYIDIFFCNHNEGKLITGKIEPEIIAQKLMEYGAVRIVIKFGEKGSMYIDKNIVVKIPANKVKVVDTTGAGDIFVSGFIAGIIKKGLVSKNDWSYRDVRDVVKFANLCGSTCVTQVGATLGNENNVNKLKKLLFKLV